MYYGFIDKTGPIVNLVKRFAPKGSGAQTADLENYQTNFDGRTLERLYFKSFIETLGRDIYCQYFIKVEYLEDNSIFYDYYQLIKINSDYYECWCGIGYDSPSF